MLTSYLERYEAIRASNAGLKAYFVTFTVKNGDDLGERFRHLRNKLRHTTNAGWVKDRSERSAKQRAQSGRMSSQTEAKGGIHTPIASGT